MLQRAKTELVLSNSIFLQCMDSSLTKFIFICNLFSGTSNVASKYEELECLYASVGKVIYEGLTAYEK